MRTYHWVFAFVFLFVVACGGSEEPTQTQATLVNSKPETPEFVDVQWVTIDSIDKEGTLVLVHDETREVTVVSLEITQEVNQTRYSFVDAFGYRLCEITRGNFGGGSASYDNIWKCDTDGSFKAYGNWHLGSGTTLPATTVTGIFVPIDTNFSEVSVGGSPVGTTTVEFSSFQTDQGSSWIAMTDSIEICTYHDYSSGMTGSTSTGGLEATHGVVCDEDPVLGYGIILFGDQQTVTTK